LKKERKKERESEDGPLPPPVASRPRTHARALILFSLSSFVLDGVVFSSSRSSLRIFIYLARRAHDDDERINTREKEKKNIASSREEKKK